VLSTSTLVTQPQLRFAAHSLAVGSYACSVQYSASGKTSVTSAAVFITVLAASAWPLPMVLGVCVCVLCAVCCVLCAVLCVCLHLPANEIV
jgi:hypothetical protein